MMSRLLALFMIAALAECAGARVLAVPQQYPTVQAALDSVTARDTVLIARGIYREALVGPAVPFVMLGEFEPDSAEPRPVLDLSSLTGADTLTLLKLRQGSRLHAANLRFQTGDLDSEWVHGIHSWSDSVSFVNCVFDSCDSPFWYQPWDTAAFHFRDCSFRGITGLGVHVGPGVFRMSGCRISGTTENSFCNGVYDCVVEGCSFEGHPGISLLSLSTQVTLRDCVFGPAQHGRSPVTLRHARGIVERCLFQSVWADQAALEISLDPAGMELRDNAFMHCYAGPMQGTGGVAISRVAGQRADAVIRRSAFLDCSGVAHANALSLGGWMRLTLERNRFFDNVADTLRSAAVQYWGRFSETSLEMRRNLFSGNGFAMRADTNVRAEWNWWGHETGPFHESENDRGMGDTLEGPIAFEPWYADTNFLSVRGIDLPLPQNFELSAYPNPFNAVVTLKLVPSQTELVTVELFDLLGRRVAEVWKGPLAIEKTVQYDASGLASGVYLVRASDTIDRRTLGLAKVVLVK